MYRLSLPVQVTFSEKLGYKSSIFASQRRFCRLQKLLFFNQLRLFFQDPAFSVDQLAFLVNQLVLLFDQSSLPFDQFLLAVNQFGYFPGEPVRRVGFVDIMSLKV